MIVVLFLKLNRRPVHSTYLSSAASSLPTRRIEHMFLFSLTLANARSGPKRANRRAALPCCPLHCYDDFNIFEDFFFSY